MSDPIAVATSHTDAGREDAVQAWLLRRPDTGVLSSDLTHEWVRQGDGAGGIRCPLCEWQPRPSSRWFCSECPVPEGLLRGCGTVWNTFETRGVCPGCRHSWQWTSCLACGAWSPHDEWYVDEDQA